MEDFIHRVISLMRHPSIRDKPVGTIGELANLLEQAYREKHMVARTTRTTSLGDQIAHTFSRRRSE